MRIIVEQVQSNGKLIWKGHNCTPENFLIGKRIMYRKHQNKRNKVHTMYTYVAKEGKQEEKEEAKKKNSPLT